MILLGFSGMALFAVSVGCLSVPQSLQDDFFHNTWKSFSDSQKSNIQDNLNCCGFDDGSKNSFNCSEGHPPCNTPMLLKVKVYVCECCAAFRKWELDCLELGGGGWYSVRNEIKLTLLARIVRRWDLFFFFFFFFLQE